MMHSCFQGNTLTAPGCLEGERSESVSDKKSGLPFGRAQHARRAMAMDDLNQAPERINQT